ncbi:MAG: hypothetical protein IT304_09070 [Dehalococcoidia bacterium]|nr:hypothetical protein [Dehalococcoidia bacterium]
MKNDPSPVSAPFQEVSAEHGALAALDEFLIHHAPTPVRIVYTTDVRAYERLWFTSQDHGGNVYVVCGLGFYPNLNTAEAYAIVNVGGQLSYVHAHRALGSNRMDMTVGPLTFDVVEPFKQWRLRLGENRFGIQFDLRWHDSKRAVFHNFGMGGGISPFGGTLRADDIAGYETFGRIDGWVLANGERFTMSSSSSNGSRDHHWGTREGVGGRERARQGGGGHGSDSPSGGQWVEFKDWSIWGARNLYNLGDPRPGTGRYLASERRLKFDPESRLFTEGLVTNCLESGEQLEVHFRRIGSQIAFLRCGAYGGRTGGTPDGDIWHGMPVGDLIGGGHYDVTRPENQALLAGLDDHLCEVSARGETTIGIFEPYEPLCWEACRDGRPGYSLLE